MLSPTYPEFKISPEDANDVYTIPNVTRKCKICGKPFALINREIGERISCPECGAIYIIQKETKIVIEPDPYLTPAVIADLDRYLKRYKNPEKYRARVLQVIEMAASGATREKIKTVVRMNSNGVDSAKRWGRMRGLC